MWPFLSEISFFLILYIHVQHSEVMTTVPYMYFSSMSCHPVKWSYQDGFFFGFNSKVCTGGGNRTH